MWSAVIKIINLYLYSSLHISLGAIALVWSIGCIVNQTIPQDYYGFVFCSTLFIYSIHRIIGIQKTYALNQKGRYEIVNTYKNHIQIYAILSGIGAAYFFFHLPQQIQLFFVIPGLISLLYTLPLFSNKTRLRDWNYIKLFLIAFVWAITTAVIPMLMIHQSSSSSLLMGLERFLFFLAITIPFDIRDQRIDQQSEVKTIVHLFGIDHAIKLSIGVLVSAFLLTYMLYSNLVINEASLCAIGLCYLLTAICITVVSKRSSDYYFTGLLDGTMILLGLLIWMFNASF